VTRGPAAAPTRSQSGRALAIAIAIIAAASSAPSARSNAATRLFITNHVSSNQIGDLASWQGSLAAATLGGVVTVDPASGATTKVIASPGGLPSNRILSIAQSPSGDLWAGTADQGLARIRPNGTFRRTLTSFDGLPTDRVQALYVTGDSIWVGTSGGVALFTENAANGQVVLRRSDSKASTGSGLISDDVIDFVSRQDTLWCATAAGLSIFAGGVWQSRAALIGVMVSALAEHQDTLWAATAAGPRRYANGAFTTVAAGHFGVSLALASSGGSFFSGTGLGVQRFNGTGWVLVAGLPGVSFGTLGNDPSGTLWAGSDVGLYRHNGTPPEWTHVTSNGPATHGVQRAAADGRGAWFTTGNEAIPGVGVGVLHYDGSKWSTVTNASSGGGLDQTSAFGLLSDRAGRLWFGHCCSATEPRPRTDRWDLAADAWDHPAATNLLTFAQQGAGDVFGGSVEHGNGVYVFDSGTAALLDSLTPLNTQGGTGAGLASNNLRDLAFDSSGRGWIAHAASGLDIWNGGGTLTNHTDDVWLRFDVGLPSLQTTSVVATGPSSGWIGTIAGVARIQNDLLAPATAAAVNAALASREIRDLTLDSGGNLWIATLLGLARVDAVTGGVEVWRVTDGLVSDDVRCLAWDSGRSVLWVGTADGISEVRPGDASGPGFDARSYVYPNPLAAGATALRLGGIDDEVSGEIRDAAGGLIRRFTCDPARNEVWDLTLANGSRAVPGIYLVVLRDGSDSRVLRVAILR
jgi:ligand-binding sensor domain-containing protein